MTTPATRKEDELLPCPFCGTNAKLINGVENEVGYFIRCEYCRLDYPSAVLNAPEKAIGLWNTRTPSVASPALPGTTTPCPRCAANADHARLANANHDAMARALKAKDDELKALRARCEVQTPDDTLRPTDSELLGVLNAAIVALKSRDQSAFEMKVLDGLKVAMAQLEAASSLSSAECK